MSEEADRRELLADSADFVWIPEGRGNLFDFSFFNLEGNVHEVL